MDPIDAALAKAQKKKDADEEDKLRESLGLSDSQWDTFLKIRDNYKPELFDINEILDDTIVGEHETRMSVFTNFILSKIPVFVSGPSAGGKTAIMDACVATLMPGDGVIVPDGSDTVIYEMEKEIKNATHVVIHEINKMNPMMIEILKSWGEGKEAERKRTNMAKGGYDTFTLPCRPFVFSRADESTKAVPIGTELMSRLVEITVDGTQSQTDAVLARQAENIENPLDIKRIDLLARAQLRYHISSLPDFDHFINPGAGILREFIPTIFTTARRDFPKYLKNIDGITKFYHKERMKIELDGKSIIFSTPKDMFLNHLIFGDTLVQSAIRCSELERMIINVVKDRPQVTKDDVREQLREWNLNVSLSVVDTHLKKLVDVGYLSAEKPGQKNIYTMSNFYNQFDMKPDFNRIISYVKDKMRTIEHYKPYAEEYIDRYCTKDAMLINSPIDGTEIDICTFDWEMLGAVDFDTEVTRIQPKAPQSGATGQSWLDSFVEGEQ